MRVVKHLFARVEGSGSRFRRRVCIRNAAELFRQPISLANLTRVVLQRVHLSPGSSWKSTKIRAVRGFDGARRMRDGCSIRCSIRRYTSAAITIDPFVGAVPSTARLPAARMGDACLYFFMRRITEQRRHRHLAREYRAAFPPPHRLPSPDRRIAFDAATSANKRTKFSSARGTFDVYGIPDDGRLRRLELI